MKKFFNLLSIILVVCLTSYVIQSCDNNSECEECKNSNFKVTQILLENEIFEAREYDSNEDITYYQLKNQSRDKTALFLNQIKSQINDININQISGFILISSSKKSKELNFKNIQNLILYENKNDFFNVRVFNVVNNSIIEEQTLSNKKTDSYAINDIYNITNLLNRAKTKNIYSFILPNFPDGFNKNSELRNSLKNKLFNSKFAAPKDDCGGPCKTTKKNTTCRGLPQDLDGYNVSYFCEGNCATEEVEDKLSNSSINYDYINIKEQLRSFRDSYLLKHNTNNSIVDDYYYLSNNLEISNVNIELCVKTFEIITNDLLPIIQELKSKPFSDEVLYSDNFRIKITNYLYTIKNSYSDDESKLIIDKIISKINYFCNKSNKQITEHLNEY